MNIKTPRLISINSFVLSSILVIFIVSSPNLGFLRVYLIVAQFLFFYLLIIYKHQKIITDKSLIIIFSLVTYVLVQSIIFQGSILIIAQSTAMVLFLFFASQMALIEGKNFYHKDQYKMLAKTLLILLPFFLISFTQWSFRQPGLFRNPNITSHLAVMLLPFIFLGLDKKKFKFLAIAIVLAIVLSTASRSATLAFALGLLSYAVVTKFPKSGFLGLFSLIGSVLLFSIYSVDIASWFSGQFSEVVRSSDSRLLNTGYNARDVLLQIAIDRFEEHPMLGTGFDGTKIILNGSELGTHNGLVDTLLKFGIIGSAIFTLFCLYLIWMISKHNARFKAATIMSLATIFSLSTNSSTFFVLNYLFIYPVLLAYLGYSIRNNDGKELSVEN